MTAVVCEGEKNEKEMDLYSFVRIITSDRL